MPGVMQGKGLRLSCLGSMLVKSTTPRISSTTPLFTTNNRLSLSSKPLASRQNASRLFATRVGLQATPSNNSPQKDHSLPDNKLQAEKAEAAGLKATEEELLARALNFPTDDPHEKSRVINNFARAYEIETWFKAQIKAEKALHRPLILQALEKAYAEFRQSRVEAFKQLQQSQAQGVTKVTPEFVEFYHKYDPLKIFSKVWDQYLKNNQNEKLDHILTQIMTKAAASARGANLFSSVFLTVYERGLLHRIEPVSKEIGAGEVTFATTASPLDASGVNVPTLARVEGRLIRASKDAKERNTVLIEAIGDRAAPILSFAEDNWRIYTFNTATNLDLKDPKYNYSYVYVEQPKPKLSFIENGVAKPVTLIDAERFKHVLQNAYSNPKEGYKSISTLALRDAITHNSEEKHIPQRGQDIVFVSNFIAEESKNENLKNKLVLVKNNDDYQLYYVGAQGKAEVIPLKDKVGFKNKLDAKGIKLDGASVHLAPDELQNHIDLTKYRLVTVLSAADDKTKTLELRFPANDTVRTESKTANAMRDSATQVTPAARESAMLFDTYQQRLLYHNLKEMRSNLAADETVITLPPSPHT